MSDQIRVVAVVTVPGTEARMEAAARACIEETRQEPFVFVETWRNAAALDGHFKQPHLAALMAEVQPIADGSIEIMRLTEIA